MNLNCQEKIADSKNGFPTNINNVGTFAFNALAKQCFCNVTGSGEVNYLIFGAVKHSVNLINITVFRVQEYGDKRNR